MPTFIKRVRVPRRGVCKILVFIAATCFATMFFRFIFPNKSHPQELPEVLMLDWGSQESVQVTSQSNLTKKVNLSDFTTKPSVQATDKEKTERWCQCKPNVEEIPTENDETSSCDVPNVENADHEALLRLSQADRIYKRNLWRRNQWLLTQKPRFFKTLLEERILEYYGTPTFPCFGERRFGKFSLAGQWICRPHFLTPESMVYSFQKSGDISFLSDLNKFANVSATVFTRNEIKSKDWLKVIKENKSLRHDFIGNEVVGDYPFSLVTEGFLTTTITSLKNLNSVKVDILRVDCNSCSPTELQNILEQTSEAANVPQVLLDISWRFIPYEMLGIFELMEVKGYRMFHSERDFTNTFKITAAYIHESFLHDYMIHL